jgi:hypothetical protein
MRRYCEPQRTLAGVLSTDAGGYVCNHSYFLALHRARSAPSAVPYLFVYIPLPRTSAKRTEIRRAACIVLVCVMRGAQPDTMAIGRQCRAYQETHRAVSRSTRGWKAAILLTRHHGCHFSADRAPNPAAPD